MTVFQPFVPVTPSEPPSTTNSATDTAAALARPPVSRDTEARLDHFAALAMKNFHTFRPALMLFSRGSGQKFVIASGAKQSRLFFAAEDW